MKSPVVLKAVKQTRVECQPKRKRISLIEDEPTDGWFVKSKTRRGRHVVYVRFQITGLHPRLYGPFSSKRQGLEFLDRALSRMIEPLAVTDSDSSDRMIDEEFRHHYPPIVEYPILRQVSPLTSDCKKTW